MPFLGGNLADDQARGLCLPSAARPVAPAEGIRQTEKQVVARTPVLIQEIAVSFPGPNRLSDRSPIFGVPIGSAGVDDKIPHLLTAGDFRQCAKAAGARVGVVPSAVLRLGDHDPDGQLAVAVE